MKHVEIETLQDTDEEYVDEENDFESANGCFTGSDYWKAEIMTDMSLYKDRLKRMQERCCND